MLREEIKNLIEKAIKELYKIEAEVKIDQPENADFGDYSTNIAMLLKKNPQEIADAIKSSLLGKIEIKNGFINFFISKEYLQKQVGEILKQKEKFGELDIGKRKKIQVEFISANPTGPLTVGNARGGPFGDTLANILRLAGFQVEKAYYINNRGNQILTLGHSVLKDSLAEYKGEYIDYLNKKIKEKNPYKAGQIAAKIIIDEIIKKTIGKLGILYDEWFFETNLYESGEITGVLDSLRNGNLIYENEGALWFKSTKYGDTRDRVVVKKDKIETYLTGDIAYHLYKFKRKKFDKVIDIWGSDHHGDIPGLVAAMEAFGYGDRLDIILLQFVTLWRGEKQVRMSKRAGTYVTMDELLDEIGSDEVKFFFLQRSADTHLNFDLDLAKEQSEKNPVYYIQYAYARICSILRKSPAFAKATSGKENFKLLNHQSELNLIKQLIRLPEVVEDTAKDYQVQRLPQYATDLATSFHQFYRDCQVLTEVGPLSEARLGLVLAVQIVLKNTLDLMGISAPEKM